VVEGEGKVKEVLRWSGKSERFKPERPSMHNAETRAAFL
jgi:hypothetical protein